MLLLAAEATKVDIGVFVVAAALVLAGAIGVVVASNPVHFSIPSS